MRICAVIFGLVFLVIGVLGFLPRFAPDGELFGMFKVNTFHNMIHLITGVIFLFMAITSGYASRVFFRIFGIIYLIVAILGFFYGERSILGVVSNNMADSWLHLVLSIIMLGIGFSPSVSKKS